MAGRKNKGGRPSKRTNIFAGLMRDARDGGTLQIVDKGGKTHGPVFVSYKAIHGVEGAKYVTFPRDTLELAVLSRLKEIDPREIMPNDEPAVDLVSTLTARLTGIEARIGKIQAALTSTDDDVAPLMQSLRRLETDRLDVAAELAKARHAAATPLSNGWNEAQSLVVMLTEAEDPEAVRMRLRAALRRIVERIVCLFVDRQGVRLAALQMEFTGGSHRVFLIWHKRGHGSGNAKGNRPSTWGVLSTPMNPEPDGFDLKNKKDIRVLDRVLASVDVSNLTPIAEKLPKKSRTRSTR
jgi:hypothetical protein